MIAMETGTAVVIVGLLALTLWAAFEARNVMALVAWGFSAVIFILILLFDFSMAFLLAAFAVVTITLTVGFLVRAAAG